MKVVGLLSGTSLDGIDVALAEIVPGVPYRASVERFASLPFPGDLRARIVAAYPPARIDARELSALHAAIGEAFGDAAARVAGDDRIDCVGSHGVTLAHAGGAHHSLQLGDPFRIRERVEATVVADFRSADTAAGGSGAPLVPYVDALLLRDPAEERVALNLGGIANITLLPAGRGTAGIRAWDTGPANLPLDGYIQRRTGGRERYDAGGAHAAAGTPDPALFAALMDDPYLRAAPPKTAGREEYGTVFLDRHARALDALAFADAVATLTAYVAQTVADAISSFAAPARVIASGGGVHNATLLGAIRCRLGGVPLEPSSAYGIDPDAKEALAFAILAVEALRGAAAGIPAVTGAQGARVLGAIAPHRLDEVIARVRREEAGR